MGVVRFGKGFHKTVGSGVRGIAGPRDIKSAQDLIGNRLLGGRCKLIRGCHAVLWHFKAEKHLTFVKLFSLSSMTAPPILDSSMLKMVPAQPIDTSGLSASALMPGSALTAINPHSLKVACSNCNLRELCMPLGLSEQELERIDDVVALRRKVKRGATLFRNGEKFTSLFAIRTGFFKTSVVTDDGRDQVTGFQMAGEVMGLDGIVSDHHSCDAIALEDAEVCVMPFERIEELSREINSLQRHVHKIMSREIVRENGVMLLLGSMRAEERLAAFLLNLAQRLYARGFSQSDLILRMTREEIGSYLGLKLETVSRTFSKFVEDKVLEVKQRHVRILNTEALRDIVNNKACL
jgi:CRP/FNR family transcriptional regulator